MLQVLTPTVVVPESDIHLDRRLCPFLLRVGGGVRGGLHLGERQAMGEMEVAKVGLGNGRVPVILGAWGGRWHGKKCNGRCRTGQPLGNRDGGQWGAEGWHGWQGSIEDEGQ